MILLKKIKLIDFLSHKDTEISFDKTEKILINGSSGAGKSSIFDAVIWCLYNVGRSDNRSLIRRGAKKAVVCLELLRQNEQSHVEDMVVITRSTTPAGKHTLEVAIQRDNGTRIAHPLTGVKELQAWINKDLIGASYLLFINSVAYVQGNSESFVSQTAPKRKELLLEIVKAEDYDIYYEKARTTLSTLDSGKSNLEGQITALNAQIEALKGHIGDKDVLNKELNECSNKLEKLKSDRDELDVKRASLTGMVQSAILLDETIISTAKERNAIQLKLEVNKGKISKKQELLDSLKDIPELETKIEILKEEGNSLRTTLSRAAVEEAKRNEFNAKKPLVTDRNKEITRYKEQIETYHKREVCPAGDKCPYHSKVLKSIEFDTNKISELLALEEGELLALDQWTFEEKKLPESIDIKKLVTEINSTDGDLTHNQSKLTALKFSELHLQTINEIEIEIPILEEEFGRKVIYVNELIKKKEDIELSVKELGVINNLLSELYYIEQGIINKKIGINSLLKGIERDEKEISLTIEKTLELNKELINIQDKIQKVELVKNAFSSKGIKTLVIDYLLPKLEDRINEVLSKLSDFRIRLDTQKKSADEENTIEGLWVTIINELGEEMPYEAYSGGEKVKISVSISEALATLQKVSFRLFDETITAFDPNSLESFTEVLETLLTAFPQTLMISHIQEIKDLFDKKIEVGKLNGKSYVRTG